MLCCAWHDQLPSLERQHSTADALFLCGSWAACLFQLTNIWKSCRNFVHINWLNDSTCTLLRSKGQYIHIRQLNKLTQWLCCEQSRALTCMYQSDTSRATVCELPFAYAVSLWIFTNKSTIGVIYNSTNHHYTLCLKKRVNFETV